MYVYLGVFDVPILSSNSINFPRIQLWAIQSQRNHIFHDNYHHDQSSVFLNVDLQLYHTSQPLFQRGEAQQSPRTKIFVTSTFANSRQSSDVLAPNPWVFDTQRRLGERGVAVTKPRRNICIFVHTYVHA